ncbi:MAG: CxxC-x17-CxxC domain-containing protein [Candidatus Paceibacterota bacterium]
MGKFNRGGGNSFGGGHGGHGGGFRARGNGFGGGDRGPVTMHDVICSDCRKNCQVPFRPSNDKPVYCKDCFAKHGGPDRANSGPMPRRDSFGGNRPADNFAQNDIKTQLSMINIKLDKLLKSANLDIIPKKEVVVAPAPVSAPVIKTKKVVKSVKAKKASKK